jgi:hypothetical protein
MCSPQKKFFITPHACPNGRAFEGRSHTEIVGSNPTVGMDVVVCVLVGTGLFDELIICPEESY